MWHAWGREGLFTGFWLGDPKVRYHWEDLGVGGRIIFCEHGDEPLGSIKRIFLIS
jgi:hypothetical protein